MGMQNSFATPVDAHKGLYLWDVFAFHTAQQSFPQMPLSYVKHDDKGAKWHM